MNNELEQVPERTLHTYRQTDTAHSQLASVGLAQARPNETPTSPDTTPQKQQQHKQNKTKPSKKTKPTKTT